MYISDPELFAEHLYQVGRDGREKANIKRILTDLEEQISLAKFNQMSSISKSYVEPIPEEVINFLKEAGIKIEHSAFASRDLVNVTNQYVFRFEEV